MMLLWPPSIAAAETRFHDHDDIQQQIRTFVYKQLPVNRDETLEVAVGRLDSRVKINRCQQPLAINKMHVQKSGLFSMVQVRCPGDSAWKLYIPVKISLLTPVVVANRPIVRHAVIKNHDLKLKKVEKAQLKQGFYSDIESVVGKKARRYFPAGHAITPAQLLTADMVKKGQTVLILAANSALKVQTKGIALASGKQGDTIKVRNRASERVVEAVVVSPGKVEVFL